MTKKIVSIIAIIFIILVSLFLVYWFYFSKPTALPADDELTKRMNEIFPEANVETIQETISLDPEHIYVPFISEDNNYGSSHWVWEGRKWSPVKIDTGGEPTVWTIHEKSPTSYIVWNIHPEDQISYANISMMRGRNFRISHTEHHYTPRVHMEDQISLSEQTYGVLVFPEHWEALLAQENKIVSAQNSNGTGVFLDVRLHFGWTAYNENDELVFPENSMSGHGFINGNIDTNFVEYVEDPQFEY